MLYETPLVIAATGMSAAMLVPQYSKMLENTGYRPGIAIVIGACLAGFSVFGGVSFALCCKRITGCIGSLLFWGAFALGTGWLAASCALAAAETGIKFFYLAAACLPLVIYLYNLLTQWNDRSCKDYRSYTHSHRSQAGSMSNHEEKRKDCKYICKDCIREISQQEYEQQDDIFCQECGGRIGKLN